MTFTYERPDYIPLIVDHCMLVLLIAVTIIALVVLFFGIPIILKDLWTVFGPKKRS